MPGIALVFAGQGAQHPAMGAAWRGTDGWTIVDRISEAAGDDVAALLLDADEDTLRRTDRAQLSTFALEMVVLAAHRARGGPAPIAYAGHSLGEYSALVAAGALGVEDAARLVAARGAAMLVATKEEPGTMVAVLGAPAETVAATITRLQESGERVWIANENAPDQTALSGDEAGIAAARDACAGIGKVLPLQVGGAFHSPMMLAAEAPLRAALDKATFEASEPPVVANVDAQPHHESIDWPALLAQQLTGRVRWTQSVRTLIDTLDCDAFVEIGPKKTLASLIKRIDRSVTSEVVAP